MNEYLLRLEAPASSPQPSLDSVESELRALRFVPRHAMRVEGGWWLQVATAHAADPGDVKLSGGWRITEQQVVLARRHWSKESDSRAVGDIFTYLLLLWPAVVGLFELNTEGWQLALKIALAIWLGLLHLVAYRGAGGRYFGNSMLMLSACVAGFWWAHPGPWMYAWLLVIVIGLYAAVRGVIGEAGRGADTGATSAAPAQETR